MMFSSYIIFALLEGFLVLVPVVAGLTIWSPHRSSSPPSPQLCPARCTCNKTIADCSHQGFRQIPDGLPSAITALNMSHNRISRIDSSRLLHLSYLKELYLQENQLTFIPSDLWVKLPHLKILDLSSNIIACSCPLEQLEKHLHDHQSFIHLINKNRTDCRRYWKELDHKEPFFLETCILKLRWKRKPSCASFQCQNGGICRDNHKPECECIPPFYGIHCEFGGGEDDRLPGDSALSIQVQSITMTTIEISWSTPDQVPSAHYRINIDQKTPPASGFHRDPVTTTERSVVIAGLAPSTSYNICVKEIFPDRGHQHCIIQTTQSFDTTPISFTTITGDWFGLQGHDQPPFPRKPILPLSKDENKEKGREMHYALISLAALFGICLLLTVMIGFVYYKRVHGNMQEEHGRTEADVSNARERGTDRGADRGNIVLVSTGNEYNADTGHVNATFDPDSVNLPQVPLDGTSMRTKDRNSGKRSVRFDLSNSLESSQHALETDDNVDTVKTNVDDNATDT